MQRRALCAALAACALRPGTAASQTAPPTLLVRLADGAERRFGRAELDALPAEAATATRRDGTPLPLRGVSVTTLLRLTGLDLARPLGGGEVASKALVARAADGYVAVFGLAEADPHLGRPPLMVVWQSADGSPWPERAGDFQLVNAGESRPMRWVRQLVSLDVRALP